MPTTLRDSTTVGRYRIEVHDEDLGARVEVLEMVGARWTLARGPFRFSGLSEALGFADDIGQGLRERVKREA